MNISEEVSKLSDKEVGMLLKAALDFNSNILVLASSYYGRMDTKHATNQFKKLYNQAVNDYENWTNSLLNDVDV